MTGNSVYGARDHFGSETKNENCIQVCKNYSCNKTKIVESQRDSVVVNNDQKNRAQTHGKRDGCVHQLR